MTIEEALSAIKNAIYGKDVRQAIHDGILQAEGGAGTVARDAKILAEKSEASAKESEKSAKAVEGKANIAVTLANKASVKSDSVQLQLDELVLDGDSSVEAAQARVGLNGVKHDTLKQRLDTYEDHSMEKIKETKLAYPERLRATFSFVDDDGTKKTYTVLKPIFDQYNVKFTFAPITTRVGTSSSYLNLDEITEMVEDGFELASHTVNHRNLIEVAQEGEQALDEELKGSLDYWNSLGFDVKHIMYPNGGYNDEVIKATRKWYESGATMDYTSYPDEEKYNHRPLHTYNIGRQGIGIYGIEPMNWDHIKEVIDNAIENKTMCVLMTHINATDDAGIELIKQAIEYILAQGYPIDTYGDAFKIHRNVVEYGDRNMRYFPSKDYYIVDAAGDIHSNRGNTFYDNEPIVDYRDDLMPIDYPQNALTIQRVLYAGAVAHNFPAEANGMVYAISLPQGQTSIRFFHDTTTDIFYVQKSANTNSWGAWKPVVETLMSVNSSGKTGLLSKPIGEYSLGQTVERITYNQATGFPVQSGGVLVTIKASNDAGFRKFYPLGISNDCYFQKNTSSTETGWTPFVKVSQEIL